ncbi:hypothetical protein F4827_002543 [Paraburkholderia bannensis]|uniref:Uncharacterized protein n=1 Tax=Paraburkholderia bannensis TaxID=765414 RepID=A0A7W9TWG9_9BURK|nr:MULTISPECIES: hypothetical protein [Paraburkholderia]MBB3257678.1 hypothetical protein [Paraburkholderia sp. WP4_3_2]MBB6102691.1 hypothetical protein [Paraburkholderia bannensis]
MSRFMTAGACLDAPNEGDMVADDKYVYEFGVVDEFEIDGVPHEKLGWEVLCPRGDFKVLFPDLRYEVIGASHV